jgi:hypothetical protein
MSKLEKLDRSRKLLDEQGKQLEETRAKELMDFVTDMLKLEVEKEGK